MRQMSRIIALFVALMCIIGCSDGSGTSENQSGKLASLDVGAWKLSVNRAVEEEIFTGVPTDTLPESSYELVTAGPTYLLEVSESGNRIAVAEPQMAGQLESTDDGRLTYNLLEGTFAGGRIVAWRDESGLQAELTIYGSGVPIVKSERGMLRKVE